MPVSSKGDRSPDPTFAAYQKGRMIVWWDDGIQSVGPDSAGALEALTAPQWIPSSYGDPGAPGQAVFIRPRIRTVASAKDLSFVVMQFRDAHRSVYYMDIRRYSPPSSE